MGMVWALALLYGVMMTGSGTGQDGAGHPIKPEVAVAGASGEALRVMTFNVRYGTAPDGDDAWAKRRGLFMDVLRRNNADLIGLQEAQRGQLDDIAHDVPGYTEIGVGRDDGETAGEYAAILFRSERLEALDDRNGQGSFWLSPTPEEPGSRGWGNRITRICTWVRLRDKRTGRTLYAFNTHMDHESQPAREKGIELIVRRMERRTHPEDPVIFTGDLNSGEENPVVRYVKGEALRACASTAEGDEPAAAPPKFLDTFRVAHPEAKGVRTYHGFKGGEEGEKIDYIFVPPGTVVLDAAIDRTSGRDGHFPSDHYPVTAVVRLPGPKASGSVPPGR
jgi:endonuclease/exonuclease/phosphatase family metal-dependent hydrolase